MMTLRRADERGHNTVEWLNSYHTFSFAGYYDEKWIRRGYVRVINEDYIQPGQGFDMHPHQNMEIITYVIQGTLKHEDSMGHQSLIKRGEIQRMSAGSGVYHSEFNASNTETLHLLQIWIFPEEKDITPSYEQKPISQKRNELILIASNEPSKEAVKIHQQVGLYAGYFDAHTSIKHSLQSHVAWIQLIQGKLNINGEELHSGDGLWMQQEDEMHLCCIQDAEFLLFKMK